MNGKEKDKTYMNMYVHVKLTLKQNVYLDIEDLLMYLTMKTYTGILITSVGRDYQDCHENKMATLLNILGVLRLHVYLRQNTCRDFSTYEGIHVYLVTTNDGKARWTANGHQGYWQGTKLASGKIDNSSYSCQKPYFTTVQSW